MRVQDDMKLPSVPSLGLPLPLDEDDLSLQDDDLLAEEAEAPASSALQETAGLPPAEHPAEASCAAELMAPRTDSSFAPKANAPAAQVSCCLRVLTPFPSRPGAMSPCTLLCKPCKPRQPPTRKSAYLPRLRWGTRSSDPPSSSRAMQASSVAVQLDCYCQICRCVKTEHIM